MLARLPWVQRVIWVLAIALVVGCSWLTELDTRAGQLADAGLKRALISFASARALNAVISVAQGTEVAVEPGGVGIVFTPGQVLDPVNDLVEQFSNLMLIASVSFGVQKMLMHMGAHWLVSLCLTVAALAWILFYLRRQPVPAWLSRLFVLLLMVRFALPLVTICTEMLFQKFMATDYQASQQSISTASGRLSELNPPPAIASETPSVIKKMQDWWAQKAREIDVKSRFEQLKLAAENATQHIIDLIVIFLLQTLLIPLLMLWILYGLVRRIFERPARIWISPPA